jgi:hypothetical protein
MSVIIKAAKQGHKVNPHIPDQIILCEAQTADEKKEQEPGEVSFSECRNKINHKENEKECKSHKPIVYRITQILVMGIIPLPDRGMHIMPLIGLGQ